MLTLACLTVSLPFVYSAKQLIEQNIAADANLPFDENEDETDNPFTNTTEEKTSNNISLASEEYIHDTHSVEQYLVVLSTEYKIEHVSTYIAFYGELICPPPDVA